ncbi:MAG: chsA, partial [Alphaproteobacteria bacterium]|nr:chsA [Alphaproteobacteria bacterium]
MGQVYLNRIATAVPGHDIHAKFVDYAARHMKSERDRNMFTRIAGKLQIDHRYSVLNNSNDPQRLDGDDFYIRGNSPDTGRRMEFYKRHAFSLAQQALDKLQFNPAEITHLIITSCTGFYAPGIDLEIIRHYNIAPSVERNFIGFMGCYAAINALKMAAHIVRSDEAAQVLILNLELCTLHLQETTEMET